MNLVMPETNELEIRALAWPDRARATTISSDAEFIAGADLLGEIKSLRDEIDATFDPIVSAAHAAHKEALRQKARHDAPLAEAERIIKGSLSSYRSEQERKRALEAAALRDAARKLEEERIIAEALEAERDGDAEAAAEIISAPIAQPVVHVAPATPKVEMAQSGHDLQQPMQELE